jgi:hypothetical protein
MPTLKHILDAKGFTEAYLGRRFKSNDEFFSEVFEEWFYHTKNMPLGDFLRMKYPR